MIVDLENRLPMPVVMRAERGTVLLLSLIVMSSVVLSSMGLGTLIVSSLQQSRMIDQSIAAYYAAESGAEEALYEARRLGQLPDSVEDPRPLDGSGASWTREVWNSENVVYAGRIERDATFEQALYDPDTEESSQAKFVQISWDGPGTLASSVVGWLPDTVWNPLPTETVDFNVFRMASSGGTTMALISVDNPDKLNRLRLRAEGGSLENVQIRAFTDSEATDSVQLPGRISIDVRGRFLGAEQKLLVSLPRLAPLAGIYDFVIFSECSISKGGLVPCQ